MSDFRDIQSESLKKRLALRKREYEEVIIQVYLEINPANIVRLKEPLNGLEKDINELDAGLLSTQIKNKLHGLNCNNKQWQILLQKIFKDFINMDIIVYPSNLICR